MLFRSVQQPDSRAHPSEIRLADDQIKMISQRVAFILSCQMGTSAFAQGSTSHDVSDQTLIPHISIMFQMITDQSVRIEQLKGCVLRLTGRVLDLQGQVLALAHPQPHKDITEVSDLSAEVARLRGVLESDFDFLRREIRGSSEHA